MGNSSLAMSESEELLRFAVCEYIKQVAETCDDEDRSESLEVASQCLPEGFGIDTEDAKYKLPRTLLEIFEIGLRACQQQSISHQERLKSDSKYSKFIKTLTGAGFFNGVVEGSADYEARLAKAHETYVAKYGNRTAANSTAPEAAPAPAPEAAPAAPAPAAPAAPAVEPTPEEIAQAEEIKGQGNKALAAKNFEEAVALYGEALVLRPGHHIYLSNRAAALSYLDRHQEASEDAQAAIEREPSYVKAYSRLGFANFQLGNYTTAIEVYEKGLEIDSSNASLIKGLQEAKEKLTLQEQGGADPAAGGAGGMADMMKMAQGMMQDPDAMQQAMNMMGGGGAGGQPDLSSLMNNPMMANMAQNMMQNPEMMQNMMNMMGGAGQQ